MKYAKPEIVASNSASEVIATIELQKPPTVRPDRNGPMFIDSAGAYEADE